MPRESHAWTSGGPAAGSASVQVVDRDVCIQVPVSGTPTPILMATPPPGEKCSPIAVETLPIPDSQREGCALLHDEGRQPEGEAPADPDLRGGMLCRFTMGPNLPAFTFRFAADGDNPLGKIEVSEGASAKIIQTLRYPHADPYLGAPPLDPLKILDPLDANFDGYKDLPLLLQCGAVGNCTYDFYLYDPATNQFVYDSFLSGLTMPMFDPANKEVKSYWHMSAGDGGHDTYQFQNGKYILIGREVLSWDREKDIITKKTYELRDGKMQLTRCDGECQEK
jgi:hypothetical protein